MTRDELRKQCLTDKLALSRLLGYDFQPDVHQELFDNYIQYDNSKTLFEQDTVKDRLILWSRGFFKTTSIVVEAIQMLLNFPDTSIMLMQGTMKNTKELLLEVKSHFDGKNPRSKLSTLFPEYCGDKLGSAMGFTVPARTRTSRYPSVFVASPKSLKAGLHPDAAFFDDLVNEINFRNPELVKKVIEEFGHYVPLVNPGGYKFVTGTRYTFGDLYEHLLRTGKWKHTVRNCYRDLPDGTRVPLFPPRKLADGRTVGLSLEMLDAKRIEIGDETFAAQYLNQPISGNRQLFTDDLLMSGVKLKDTNASVGPALLFVDLAASVSNEADSSVVLCGRQIQGVPTVTDIRHGQWSTLQIAHTILEMALLHRPIKVLIEGSAGSSFFIEYLRMIAKDKGIALYVEPIKISNNKGAKHLRIAAVEGAIKTRRLAFLAGLPGWSDLVEQFKQFPKGRHDDLIDTVSLMVQFYSGHIAIEPFPEANLPFFLRTPGVDFSFENRLLNSDSEALAFIPEAVF